MAFLLLAQLGSTLFMVGLIWFVQIVHYPLFAQVGRSEFSHYEQLHQRYTTWVVAPVMCVELVTAIGLVLLTPPGISRTAAWVGLAILALIWLSTAALQVPSHNALATDFSPLHHSRLVTSNWIRTVGWSLRGLVVLTLTMLALS